MTQNQQDTQDRVAGIELPMPAVQEYIRTLAQEVPLSILFLLNDDPEKDSGLRDRLPDYLNRRVPTTTLYKWLRTLASLGAITQQRKRGEYNITEIGRSGVKIYLEAERETLPALRAYYAAKVEKLVNPGV